MSVLSGINDAEAALQLWLHLRSGGDQIRSLDLYESKEICARGACGGTQTFQGSLRNRIAVCMKCRQPWRGRTVPIVEPRARGGPARCASCGEGRKRRFHGAARCSACRRPWKALEQTVHPRTVGSVRVRRDLLPLERITGILKALRPVIETRPPKLTNVEWEFDVRAFALHVEGNGRSYAAAAIEGARLWPEWETGSRWWSERKVRDAVAHARFVIEKRLGAARSRRRNLWMQKGAGMALLHTVVEERRIWGDSFAAREGAEQLP